MPCSDSSFSDVYRRRVSAAAIIALLWCLPAAAQANSPTLVIHDPQYLVATDAGGLAVDRWQGLLDWQGLPPALPLMIRAYDSTGRILMPARFLVEAYFDLMEVPGAEDHHEIRLELVLVKGQEAPSEANLLLPAEQLIFTDRVQAVLRSRVRRVERSTPPSFSESATPVGFRLLGKLPETSNRPRCSDVESLQALDLESVWNCFWEALGPAVLPEIPLYDFDELSRITRRLRRLGPNDWRSSMAEAQVWALREHHRNALDKLDEAAALCGTGECRDLILPLRYFVEIDQYSTFDRSRLFDWSSGIDAATSERLTAASTQSLLAVDKGPPGLRSVIHAWYAGVELRKIKGAVEALKYSVSDEELHRLSMVLPSDLFPDPAMADIGRLLDWSRLPRLSDLELQDCLAPVKTLFQVEDQLAPHGEAIMLNFNLLNVLPTQELLTPMGQVSAAMEPPDPGNIA